MATATTETVEETEVVPEPEHPEPYRMTVEIYDKLVDAGVFGDTAPFYLWKGQLVLPMPKGPPHEYAQNVLLGYLFRLIPEGWTIRPGGPTRLGNNSEPEPDITVVRGSARDYLARHPAAGDVALAIEVADSSRRFDLGEKLAAYAAEGIPIYWVVNIPEKCLDVYTNPTGSDEVPGYGSHQRLHAGDPVAILLNGREVGRVAVADVLP